MHKNRVVVAAVFIIISCFIFKHYRGVGSSVIETVSSCCLYPLLRIQHMIVDPIAHWFSRSASTRELEKTIEDLQSSCDALCAENVALKAVCSYADETGDLRNFSKRYLLGNGQIGQVLARHFSSSSQFFLVDAGSSQGIKKDMVALYRNAIVGRVAEVYPWYCKVCLITDSDCKVASFCSPATISAKKNAKKGVSGIHEGINNVSHTILRYVSHLESIKVGDELFSSGEGLVFPKGFALGKVICADKGDLFYDIKVQPSLDFQTLRYCALIAKENI